MNFNFKEVKNDELLNISSAQCATTILRLFPCLMAKVGMVAKKGKNHNRKQKVCEAKVA